MQSISVIALKMVKVSKLVQSKLIPYRSIIGLEAFRKINYFGDIPRQVKIIQKCNFAVLLTHNITHTSEKSSKN